MSTKKDQGIRSSNREFTRYDQVDKSHTYALADSGQDSFDESFRLKTCDMRQFFTGGDAGKRKFAEELGASLAEIGFGCLVGHGVDPALYEEANRAVVEVMTRPGLAEKMRFRAKRFGSVQSDSQRSTRTTTPKINAVQPSVRIQLRSL